MSEFNNIYRGIIIVKPHGDYIADGTKTIIIKSIKLHDIAHKPLLLIQDKLALGIIYLDEYQQIDLKKFNKLKTQHKITDEERKKWWHDKKVFYEYAIIKTNIYKIPIPIEYPIGPQVLVKIENITKKQNIYIGTSGYKYEWWNDSGYNKFDIYNMTFNTVEINASFYNFYSQKTWKKIIDESPDDFIKNTQRKPITLVTG